MDVINAEQVRLFYHRSATVLDCFASLRLASPKKLALAQSWLWSVYPLISVLKVMLNFFLPFRLFTSISMRPGGVARMVCCSTYISILDISVPNADTSE